MIYELTVVFFNYVHFQVQALYDFDAQPGTGELSINAGDILTVTRTDVGDGWWEGSNTRGESGLFPEAYVEVRKKNVHFNHIVQRFQKYLSNRKTVLILNHLILRIYKLSFHFMKI